MACLMNLGEPDQNTSNTSRYRIFEIPSLNPVAVATNKFMECAHPYWNWMISILKEANIVPPNQSKKKKLLRKE